MDRISRFPLSQLDVQNDIDSSCILGHIRGSAITDLLRFFRVSDTGLSIILYKKAIGNLNHYWSWLFPNDLYFSIHAIMDGILALSLIHI